MSTDAIAIRRATAAARRICPAADLDGFAEVSIRLGAPLGVVIGILFDEITAAAPPSSLTSFRRASFAAIVGANRWTARNRGDPDKAS